MRTRDDSIRAHQYLERAAALAAGVFVDRHGTTSCGAGKTAYQLRPAAARRDFEPWRRSAMTAKAIAFIASA